MWGSKAMRHLALPCVSLCLVPADLAAKPVATYPRRATGATYVSGNWPLPKLEADQEPAPTETLAEALDAAYRTSPELQARRYELRATDGDYALALSELRPTTQLRIEGGYSRTDPGDTTDAARPLADRLNSPFITSNSLAAQLIVDQPLYTGGKATSDAMAAAGAIRAGREQLRGVEGDLFLQVVTAYAVGYRPTARCNSPLARH